MNNFRRFFYSYLNGKLQSVLHALRRHEESTIHTVINNANYIDFISNNFYFYIISTNKVKIICGQSQHWNY